MRCARGSTWCPEYIAPTSPMTSPACSMLLPLSSSDSKVGLMRTGPACASWRTQQQAREGRVARGKGWCEHRTDTHPTGTHKHTHTH